MTAPNNIPFADWTVSPQRTVTLSGNGSLPCVCSDGVSAYGAPAWSSKASADNLDYAIDCTAWLASGNDTLASVQAWVSDGDGALVVLSPGWSSIMRDAGSGRVYAVIWLGGGTPSSLYSVEIVLTTLAGRQITASVYMPINALSGADANPVPELSDGTPVPPNALRLPDKSILSLGASVTDQIYFDLLLPDGTTLQNSMMTNTPYLSDLLLPDGAALQGADGNALGIDAVDTQTELIGPLGAIEMQTNTDILLIA